MFLGCELYINEIVARLQNVFQLRSFNSNDLRKTTLLLMLNTDISLSRDLREDYTICHLLNNFPQLSKCLFVNLVWQLKLEKYFYEAIRFTPSWFMLQFLEETIDSLRFSKSFDVITQVKDLVQSIYCSICRMDFKMMNSSQLVEQKIILSKLFDLAMSLLRTYNTPNADDSLVKSKKKLREYLGHSLNHQLALIHQCFKMFHNKPEFSIGEDVRIFKLLCEKEPEIDNHSASSYSPVVQESLSKINFALLNILQNSVMNITLDDFMYWVEIDIEDATTEDEELKRDNLQKSIGEQSFALIELINGFECFQHDVTKQLQTISIKPKTLPEIAREATMGTVLEKIETSSNKRVWLEELLSRPETLYCNTECLQTVAEHVDVLELKDLQRVIADHQKFDVDPEDEMQIKEILRAGANVLSNIERRDLTEELIRVFGIDFNMMHDNDAAAYSTELTDYLNKLTEVDFDEDKMWKLIVTNPSKFFETLMANVASQDKSQIDIVLKILSDTHSVAIDYIRNNVSIILESETEAKKSFNHVFLAGLFKQNLVDRQEFMRDVVMDNLAKAMASDGTKTIVLLLNTLKQISGRLNAEDLIPPLMILLAQVLEKYRWDLVTFSQTKETVVESSIEVIQDLVKLVLISGAQKDKDWIVSKVGSCKPMTKFYFQKLSLEKGESIIFFDQFLHPDGFEAATKNNITSFLCETIVRSTAKEFKWLMSNPHLQPFITDALIVVAVIATKSGQQGAVNCLHKCVSDYIRVTKVRLMMLIILKLFF